jgi:hypothetical protein
MTLNLLSSVFVKAVLRPKRCRSLGVAYETFWRQPIRQYWVAPFLVLVCIGAGWHNTPDAAAHGAWWCRKRCTGSHF